MATETKNKTIVNSWNERADGTVGQAPEPGCVYD